MSFSGDLYPEAGATSVLSTKGDLVRYDSERERYGIGSANQILQVKSSLPSWQTVPLADTVLTVAGDILYENATPELARLAAGTQYNTLQMGASLPAWSPSATSIMSTTGDLLYASGANTLARLAGGTSGDVLTANGAGVAPSYQTPSSGGVFTEIADVTLTGTGNLASGTFAHYDNLLMYCWRENNTSNSTGFIFNSTGASNQYSTHYLTDMTTDEDYASTHSVIINGSYNTQEAWFITMNIWNVVGEEHLCSYQAVLGNGAGNQNLGTSLGLGKSTYTTDITSIQCTADGGSVTDQKTGSRMIVLGANP